jgi:hypothetical protein
MRPNLYLGLVHHPIKNKRGEVITTSVTNMDLHDISRTSRTFGFSKYFVITPLVEQHKLIQRILGHWKTDTSNDYNPDRSSALSYVEIVNSVEESVEQIKKIEQKPVLVAVTGAQMQEAQGSIEELYSKALFDKACILLLFGTGWGLDQKIVDMADFRLDPLYGSASDGYNHLSVRSAAAIYTYLLSERRKIES